MEKTVYFRKEEKEIFVYILIVLIETTDQYHNTYSREELNQRKFALLISFLSFDFHVRFVCSHIVEIFAF